MLRALHREFQRQPVVTELIQPVIFIDGNEFITLFYFLTCFHLQGDPPRDENGRVEVLDSFEDSAFITLKESLPTKLPQSAHHRNEKG